MTHTNTDNLSQGDKRQEQSNVRELYETTTANSRRVDPVNGR